VLKEAQCVTETPISLILLGQALAVRIVETERDLCGKIGIAALAPDDRINADSRDRGRTGFDAGCAQRI
jgi:hypothetical protein